MWHTFLPTARLALSHTTWKCSLIVTWEFPPLDLRIKVADFPSTELHWVSSQGHPEHEPWGHRRHRRIRRREPSSGFPPGKFQQRAEGLKYSKGINGRDVEPPDSSSVEDSQDSQVLWGMQDTWCNPYTQHRCIVSLLSRLISNSIPYHPPSRFRDRVSAEALNPCSWMTDANPDVEL